MMEKVLNLYKPAGLTPLQAIQKFKQKNPEYQDIKMGYAGRLDPLAEGVLIVLCGDELKAQEKYWNLDKTYVADILFGFSTDTYDVLGIPSLKQMPQKLEIEKILKAFEGKFTFSFPPYSSYKIKGKPLFWWARSGNLDKINIPQKTVRIYSIKIDNIYTLDKKELAAILQQKIDSVGGDFRQEEIKQSWNSSLESVKRSLITAKTEIHCSSGTYIRSLAHSAGMRLGSGGVLMGLIRTRVGEFEIKDSIKI